MTTTIVQAPTFWHKLTPEDLPEYGRPVLLKLVGKTLVPRAAEESGDPVRPDVFYNYAVGVLVFELDGFQRKHPRAFFQFAVQLGTLARGFEPLAATNTIPLGSVEAWAAIPG